LGTADERLRWLATVGQARLEVVRALQQEFDSFSQPYREQLLDAKAQLRASPNSADLRDRLVRLVTAFRDAIRQFLADREARFEEVGLPIDQLMSAVAASFEAWIESQAIEATDDQRPAVDLFKPQFQAFLGPARQTPWKGHTAETLSVYEDSLLRISKTFSPPGLRLEGTVDASNVDAVARALMANVDGTGEFRLDLSGLLFCDLGGMRAIVEAAQKLRHGRKLYLDGIPDHLERTIVLARWTLDPSSRIQAF
jgi:anti-anti-sigma regulatory factor